MELRSYSHGYWQITYHIVLVPKYRHKIFSDLGVKKDFESILNKLCLDKGYKIHALEVMDDHVHLFLEFHPSDSLSIVIKNLKGITARELFKQHPELKKQLWGGSLWSDGKFFRSVGNVTADTIKHYINESQHKPGVIGEQKQTSLKEYLR